jgi:ATP-dependent Clp protease ATP-binding subunit ClpC
VYQAFPGGHVKGGKMTSRFEKFTEKARGALTQAQDEAYHLNHNYIGTEHILLGILRQQNGVANKVLVNLGADLGKIRTGVELIIGKGKEPVTGEIGLTPRAKRVIELAIDEARHLGHDYVGTEHLLLGLLHEGGGVAAGVLDSFGITLEGARSETNKILSQTPNKQPSTAKSSALAPALDQFSVDLTAMARTNKLDIVIGRDIEIQRVMQILNRRTKNNPALIGNPGIGKTAIIKGLALRIAAGNIPDFLENKRIVMLDMACVMAGPKSQGEHEIRLKKILDEVKSKGNVVLFVNELQTIAHAATNGNDGIASLLKLSLAQGHLQIIGAATLENYRKFIESDPELESYFLPVLVKEPTTEQTLEILRAIRAHYEAHHKLKINDEALNSAVILASKYITNRFLPEKAIDLIDEAASMVRIQKGSSSTALRQAKRLVEVACKQKETALAAQQYDAAALHRQTEIELGDKIQTLEKEQKEKDSLNKLAVTSEDIVTVVSMWTGIPTTQLVDKTEK